jgi:hypothetical protein
MKRNGTKVPWVVWVWLMPYFHVQTSNKHIEIEEVIRP